MIKYIQYLSVFLFLFNISAYGQILGNDNFNQDEAIIHDEAVGLPAVKVSKVFLLHDQPQAITEKGTFAWDGKRWDRANAQTEIPIQPGHHPMPAP